MKFCNRAHKVIFENELEAKIALAERVWKGRGEVRYYSCHGHFHLTSMSEAEYQNSLLRASLTSSAA